MNQGAATTYRLGVDVGGTFTDLLLIDESSGETFSAKVPSTPADSSIGVLNGIARICEQNGIAPERITHVMHGTTVATNTVLEGKGARVGLVTTAGYRHVLQIARSFVPGGLGGWVIYNKRALMAPLELTIEADERLDARGEVVKPLDEAALVRSLTALKAKNIEALTVCLVNAYASGRHELRVREVAEKLMPGVPVSISSEVMPEMYEYERTETTVVNSYIRPVVSRYIDNLHRELKSKMKEVQLHVLRSDGGLSSVEAAGKSPVNMLMSGPAGGVSGAQWIARESGFQNLLTFDMGGTSTDVALIQNGVAQARRETRVADVTVRAPSIDVRTVGAGGGSIAYVPDLTKALRVGPQSAGAAPGPAAYRKGGDKPTVTDANVVLGYLPTSSRLGGDMQIDRTLAEAAVATIAGPLNKSIKEAAEGVINIVNENMFGALRMISVQQGYDPRDFALMGFGGAGPLHVNAVAKLMGSWPAVSPVSPGVLCALGDATTRMRTETARSYSKRKSAAADAEVLSVFDEMARQIQGELLADGVAQGDIAMTYEIDVRYHGQAFEVPMAVSLEGFDDGGLTRLAAAFDEEHRRLFTFNMDAEHEFVNLRAVAMGQVQEIPALQIQAGDGDPIAAKLRDHQVWVDGGFHDAVIYDRARLRASDRIVGPAIVTEMDSTTLVLPDCVAIVDAFGTILINPA